MILAEARLLAGQGVKEITLLGQTVNSYKFREPDGRLGRLSDLLERIHDIAGIERIKFITNFPNDMTDDLLQAVRDLPKVCRVHPRSRAERVRRGPQADEADVHGRVSTRRCWLGSARRFRAWRSRATSSSGFAARTRRRSSGRVGLVERSRFKNSFIFKYSAAARDQGRRALSRRRSRGGQEAAEQRAARLADGDQPGRQPPVDRQDGRGAGGRAEREDGPARRLGGQSTS